MHIYKHENTNANVFKDAYVCLHIYINMYVYIFIYLSLCIQIQILIYLYICTQKNMRMHVCIQRNIHSRCIYTYFYVWIHNLFINLPCRSSISFLFANPPLTTSLVVAPALTRWRQDLCKELFVRTYINDHVLTYANTYEHHYIYKYIRILIFSTYVHV